MSDLNSYACTARLGADPDCRKFTSGDPVVNLRVAISDQWKNKDTGERQERTLWMPVTITSKGLCKIAESYLKKGSKVALSGHLQSRSYEKNGNEVWITELILGPFNSTLTMLDHRGDGDAPQASQSAPKPVVAPAFEGGAYDETIPF